MKKTIAVDFDGVIHKYSKGWQDGSIYDPLMEGAEEGLKELSEDYVVVIFTTRAETGLKAKEVSDWVQDQTGLYFPATNVKLPALHTIDDRAIRFSNWAQALEDVKTYGQV